MFLKSKRLQGSARIALLTPYNGGNLGDAAIQEALIANLSRYRPDIEVWGITLDPARTSARHQIPCFPLAGTSLSYYRGTQERVSRVDTERPSLVADACRGLYRCLRWMARAVRFVKWIKILVGEALHMSRSYVLLRKVDALVIAGGGQLDDEWGGSWGHPYALMKWAVVARAAGSSVVFLSVGACRIDSQLTRTFLKAALSSARYRSYRDEESRRLAIGITPRADGPVIPDLAFSLPIAQSKAGVRVEGAPLRVGVSPIAYCHPELWPTKSQIQYEQYITELAVFVSRVLQGGDSVWLFSSSSPDDQLFTDLYRRLDPALDPAARDRLFSIPVNTLRELLEGLLSVDLVVASRLHGLLLSFLSGKPALAISYDRKVKSLMDELGQAAYCVEIGSFKSDDLLRLFLTLRTNRDAIVAAVAGICRKYDWVLQQQYREIMQFLAGRSADPLPLHTQALSETKS
jgi:polysaccharide pyruvyl transferase WcaK-like protein